MITPHYYRLVSAEKSPKLTGNVCTVEQTVDERIHEMISKSLENPK